MSWTESPKDEVVRYADADAQRVELQRQVAALDRAAEAQLGVIDDEMAEVFPELVGTDSQYHQLVRYERLVAPLIKAVTELTRENDGPER